MHPLLQPSASQMCFSLLSSLMQHQQQKPLQAYCKCGAARIIQAGAASVDLCPKYAHASGGQECGAPKLIVRISGGLCTVYTAQRSGKSSLVLSDCRFFLRAVGARQRKRGTGRKNRSTNNTAHLPVKLTNSDRQLTHSSKQRPMSGLWHWQEAAHPPVYV